MKVFLQNLNTKSTLTTIDGKISGPHIRVAEDPIFLAMCMHTHNIVYRVSQEERSIFWEVIVSVILSKNVYMNMCPIFDFKLSPCFESIMFSFGCFPGV